MIDTLEQLQSLVHACRDLKEALAVLLESTTDDEWEALVNVDPRLERIIDAATEIESLV